MVRRILGIISIIFLLFSCAQVQGLTGGEKDVHAPRVRWEQSSFKNGSTNFQEKQIELLFDEYFKLNNPSQTISIVPNDAIIHAKFVRKRLILTWEEDLVSNTTYSIFLNKTISDLTERNDSIMQLVFSTGPVIDSLRFSCSVIDALKDQPVKGVVVGLFLHQDSLSPYYFVQSDKAGKAEFNYLKAGSYHLRAFIDDNRNLKLDRGEEMAFKEEVIVLDSHKVDSLPLRLSKPKGVPTVNIYHLGQERFAVGANHSIREAQLTFNGKVLTQELLHFYKGDSLTFLAPLSQEANQQLILSHNQYSDTLTVRVPLNKRDSICQLQLSNKNPIYPKDSIYLETNAEVIDFNPDKILILNKKDSSRLNLDLFQVVGHRVLLNFDRSSVESVDLLMEEGALQYRNSCVNEPLHTSLQVLQTDDLGTLRLNLSSFHQPVVLSVKKGSQVVKEAFVREPNIFSISLPAGDYTFDVLVDQNGNGQWDPVNFEEQIQPERVLHYSDPVKVRVNWEIDLTLEAKQ